MELLVLIIILLGLIVIAIHRHQEKRGPDPALTDYVEQWIRRHRARQTALRKLRDVEEAAIRRMRRAAGETDD